MLTVQYGERAFPSMRINAVEGPPWLHERKKTDLSSETGIPRSTRRSRAGGGRQHRGAWGHWSDPNGAPPAGSFDAGRHPPLVRNQEVIQDEGSVRDAGPADVRSLWCVGSGPDPTGAPKRSDGPAVLPGKKAPAPRQPTRGCKSGSPARRPWDFARRSINNVGVHSGGSSEPSR